MDIALSAADLNGAIDQEPRVLDTKLGFSLGVKNPAVAMRQMIKRNMRELLTYGVVSSSEITSSEVGGRPGKEYWLNEGQALVICALSRTENAAKVRKVLIDVFMEHRRGQLALPAPRPALTDIDLPPAHSIMRIGGQTVLVDMRRYRVGPDDKVVRLHADSRVTIGHVDGRRDADSKDERTAWEAPRKARPNDPRRAKWVQGLVHVVGTVVSGTAVAKIDKADHPKRFEPGSDTLLDLVQAVRSANHRVGQQPGLSFGQALMQTLEDIHARKDDPAVKIRGVILDWDEGRASEDAASKFEAEGKTVDRPVRVRRVEIPGARRAAH